MTEYIDFGPMIAALDKMSKEARRAGRIMAARTRETQRKLKRMRRTWRKEDARETKRAAIEARQVRRAEVIVNRAPSLIHNGKAAR